MESTCPDCGLTFDDFDHLTICPHGWFPPGVVAAAVREMPDRGIAHYLEVMGAVVLNADSLIASETAEDIAEATYRLRVSLAMLRGHGRDVVAALDQALRQRLPSSR